MKSIEEIKQGCGSLTNYKFKEDKVKCGYIFPDESQLICPSCKAILKQTEEIIKLVEKRIRYCKSQLQEDFEKDKIWEWRISGFEEIISQIKRK